MHHRRGLRRLLKDDDLARSIELDWQQANLSPQRSAMLAYSVKLTRTPGVMTSADLSPLREAGFSDRDILDITEVVSYYAYVNRIADGLGVQLESWIPED